MMCNLQSFLSTESQKQATRQCKVCTSWLRGQVDCRAPLFSDTYLPERAIWVYTDDVYPAIVPVNRESKTSHHTMQSLYIPTREWQKQCFLRFLVRGIRPKQANTIFSTTIDNFVWNAPPLVVKAAVVVGFPLTSAVSLLQIRDWLTCACIPTGTHPLSIVY